MRPGASVQWHQCHRCVLQRLTESSSLCPRPLPLALYNSEIVLWLVQWTVWVLLGGFVVLAIAMLAVVGAEQGNKKQVLPAKSWFRWQVRGQQNWPCQQPLLGVEQHPSSTAPLPPRKYFPVARVGYGTAALLAAPPAINNNYEQTNFQGVINMNVFN